MFGLSPWRSSGLLSELLHAISYAWLTNNLISSGTNAKRWYWSISFEATDPQCVLCGRRWFCFKRQCPEYDYWSTHHGKSKGSSYTNQITRSPLCCWMRALLLGGKRRHWWSVNVIRTHISFPSPSYLRASCRFWILFLILFTSPLSEKSQKSYPVWHRDEGSCQAR